MIYDYPATDVAAMRAWLADCEWRDIDAEDLADLPAFAIVRATQRHYVGGVAAFMEDAR